MDLTLQPKQAYALVSKATEILYGGAAGGGKSHLMRVAAIMWCLLIPGLQVYIFRRTFPDLWKNHMEGPTSFPMMLASLLLSGEVKINYSKNMIVFKNGSKIFLCHCQYEKDMYDYQGAEIHVLMIDELTHFTDSIYRYLRARVRMTGVIVPTTLTTAFPRIICGSNPGGEGHNWVKNTFVDYSAPMHIRRSTKKEGRMLRQYIPAKLEDNPALMASDPDYIDRLEGLGNEALVQAYKDGNWDIVAGGMFDDVWDKTQHFIPPFEIPGSWYIDRSFDWGSAKPFSVGWWAESDGTPVTLLSGEEYTFPRGTLFRIAEWYGWNGEPNTGCRMLATEVARGIIEREDAMQLRHRCKPGPADSSIYNMENGHSIASDMEMVGILWEKANKSPGSRKQGWELMRRYFKAARDRDPDTPGMYIFNTCRQFARTIPVLTRLPRDEDDIDTNTEDHIADETRYRALAIRNEVKVRKLAGL